jgi:hypothetical protein
MHALSHSLAHRPPPATRPRIRWQPYSASLQSSLSSRPSPVSYLNTPASSVSSPPTSALSVCELERLRLSLPTLPKTPNDIHLRDIQKKYVTGLVGQLSARILPLFSLSALFSDQAVKSLSEIWNPKDIPSVFLTSSRATVVIPLAHDPSLLINKSNSFHHRITQLPSPSTPSTQRSPSSPPPSTSSNGSRKSDSSTSSVHRRNTLVPIKGFVHEVLKRSRTSGNVLETALCYLEAIRSKIPELVRQDQLGSQDDSVSSSRISQGDIDLNEYMDIDTTTRSIAAAPISEDNDETAPQVPPPLSKLSISQKPKAPSPPLQPLPPLPSPLLCPRRAFLASLILASKFTQDKCYSNRAWAKLSGLPPREIGRCERALGDALEWRLWVGKLPTSSTSSSPSANGRAVVRSQSDGDLLSGSKSTSGWRALPSPTRTSEPGLPYQPSTHRGLRRCATLPATAYSEPTSSAIAVPFTDPFSESVNDTVSPESMVCMTPTYSTTHSQPDKVLPSPSLATPTLTFSPSSTESSSGDRTIQMNSFIDEPTATSTFVKSGCFVPITNDNEKSSSPRWGGGGNVAAGYPNATYAFVNPYDSSHGIGSDFYQAMHPYTVEVYPI